MSQTSRSSSTRPSGLTHEPLARWLVPRLGLCPQLLRMDSSWQLRGVKDVQATKEVFRFWLCASNHG
jgi:hypothetical protein